MIEARLKKGGTDIANLDGNLLKTVHVLECLQQAEHTKNKRFIRFRDSADRWEQNHAF